MNNELKPEMNVAQGLKLPRNPARTALRPRSAHITDISHLDHLAGFSRRMSPKGGYSRLSSPHHPKSEKMSHRF